MKKNDYFQAFALKASTDEQSPPALSARGEYDLANFIVKCARKHGVPIVERPDICSALEELEIDEQIPVELFEAAAALLVEVGAIEAKKASLYRKR
jgi:flagellar biosynthesis protein